MSLQERASSGALNHVESDFHMLPVTPKVLGQQKWPSNFENVLGLGGAIVTASVSMKPFLSLKFSASHSTLSLQPLTRGRLHLDKELNFGRF